MLKNLCSLLIVLVALSCAARAQTQTADNTRQAGNLGEKIDEYLSRSAEPGFSKAVLLARNGKIVLKKATALPTGKGAFFSRLIRLQPQIHDQTARNSAGKLRAIPGSSLARR